MEALDERARKMQMGKSLFDKVWDLHTVQPLPGGQRRNSSSGCT